MGKFSELSQILSKQLKWHKPRIDCLMQMLISLITVRTVNLRELAVGMSSKKVQISSREKRLYRFFAHFKLDLSVIGRWIIQLFFPEESVFYIAVDRTNWFWGKSPINIFVASMCYEGIGIPFFWKVLPKEGTLSGAEQIELLDCAIQLAGQERIAGVLADREFGNQELIGHLGRKKVPFYIRFKEDNFVYVKGKKFKKAGQLFKQLKRYSPKVYDMAVEIGGQSVYLAGSKNEKDELMIVVTNAHYKQAIPIYLRRWEVECLFQSLKNRGFRFESTHITDPQRIEKMMAILSIAFVWAHRTGEWRAETKPIKFKRLKTFLTVQQRPLHSFFRYGFDLIRDAITGLTINWKLLKHTFSFLDLSIVEARL